MVTKPIICPHCFILFMEGEQQQVRETQFFIGRCANTPTGCGRSVVYRLERGRWVLNND